MFGRRDEPYQSLAGIYDYVMRHVDYESWTAYIRQVMERFAHRPRTMVDLACGTGNIGLELCAAGYPVTTGVDASEAMLRVAREKALLAGHSIDFVRRDLRFLSGLEALAGLVLITWTASFLYYEMQRYWNIR